MRGADWPRLRPVCNSSHLIFLRQHRRSRNYQKSIRCAAWKCNFCLSHFQQECNRLASVSSAIFGPAGDIENLGSQSGASHEAVMLLRKWTVIATPECFHYYTVVSRITINIYSVFIYCESAKNASLFYFLRGVWITSNGEVTQI